PPRQARGSRDGRPRPAGRSLHPGENEMSTEAQPPDKISNTTGRRSKTDYHKGMDATALALSISNHLKYTLAKHPEGATLHDQYWSAASAIRDRLVDRWIATQK